MLRRSDVPVEAWLSSLAGGRTPYGIETEIERLPAGTAIGVWRPKEPVPYFVHARVEFAGREPQFVSEVSRAGLAIRERYRFECPSVLHVYYWVEERAAPAPAGEPAQRGAPPVPATRNVTYLCATPEQLARAREVMAALGGRSW